MANMKETKQMGTESTFTQMEFGARVYGKMAFWSVKRERNSGQMGLTTKGHT
eukprot:CAMPEP_0202972244 /NCGR_PEP_ID=MMETSP1396-20130829/34695_1 /ASSEMBLY_ACC=CAM_ASM_000872 /TAXON_ID= /ORGANISM="Pseudokeronopsis sp., Strain Brazil" /LENGTH=51 /DNA_ID=CAMNT_0049702445 /DNA_START=168 /DNA_END=323 /DNA_ORIENTATION=-